MYVMAKGLSEQGLSVTFIEDRKDQFPHSQPVWDDIDCFFKSGFNYQSINWDDFEKEYSWIQPDWYIKPINVVNGEKVIYSSCQISWPIKLIACKFLMHNKKSLSVFNEMRCCDFLIVCGVEAIIIALLSGKPYLIIPHGSDMRKAIGAEKDRLGIRAWIFDLLLAYAFKKAITIGSQIPDASAEVATKDYKRLKNLKVDRIPLPYQHKQREGPFNRKKKLLALFSEMGFKLPEAELYSFTPSRISFYWKGHDRLIDAIKEQKDSLKIHFIFLGWGDDYLEAMAYVDKCGLNNFITILPIFCSKKRLFRLFESVDFIIDEFNGSGSYGTSLSEAMSRGCPIVTWISDMYNQEGWEAPPVIQARTKNEIATTINQISSRQVDLDNLSIKTVDWFKRVHSNEAVASIFREKFDNHIQNFEI